MALTLVGVARAAPANDAFANAIAISGTVATLEGTTVGATREAGEPVHGGVGFGLSVWYRWTAPASGPVRLDTHGSVTGTVLAVYTGSRVDALTAVAGNVYASGNSSTKWSEVAFTATSGVTYRIAVDTYGTAAGTFKLHLNPPRPPNDAFAGAGMLAGESGAAAGSLVRATAEPGEPSHWNGAQYSIWYRWSPAAGGRVTLSTAGSEYTTSFAVYSGSALSSLSPVTPARAIRRRSRSLRRPRTT